MSTSTRGGGKAAVRAGAKAVVKAGYDQEVEDTVRKLARRKAILDNVRNIMSADVHYGVIPGTEKPVLYKSGAETLALVFGLRTEVGVTAQVGEDGHATYTAECKVYDREGAMITNASASCSTREAKYLYRLAEPVPTGRPVPREYWELKKRNRLKEAQDVIGGRGYGVKKIGESWQIVERSEEKVEHDNPADYYNTVLKMAEKRAYVGAIIRATASSHLFTQDLDEAQWFAGGAEVEGVAEVEVEEQEQDPKRAEALEALAKVLTTQDREVRVMAEKVTQNALAKHGAKRVRDLKTEDLVNLTNHVTSRQMEIVEGGKEVAG